MIVVREARRTIPQPNTEKVTKWERYLGTPELTHKFQPVQWPTRFACRALLRRYWEDIEQKLLWTIQTEMRREIMKMVDRYPKKIKYFILLALKTGRNEREDNLSPSLVLLDSRELRISRVVPIVPLTNPSMNTIYLRYPNRTNISPLHLFPTIFSYLESMNILSNISTLRMAVVINLMHLNWAPFFQISSFVR